MSVTGYVRATVDVAGLSFSSALARSAEGQIGQSVSVSAPPTGTLSTRTSASAGEATLEADHGITTGAVVDVYWSGGRRYGVTVGTVDGTAVPLTDSGAGNDYPVQDTAITVCAVTTVDVDFDGDLIELLALMSDQAGLVTFLDAEDAVIVAVDLTANEAWYWASGSGLTNPLASEVVASAYVSQSGTAAATVQLGLVYDSVSWAAVRLTTLTS